MPDTTKARDRARRALAKRASGVASATLRARKAAKRWWIRVGATYRSAWISRVLSFDESMEDAYEKGNHAGFLNGLKHGRKERNSNKGETK